MEVELKLVPQTDAAWRALPGKALEALRCTPFSEISMRTTYYRDARGVLAKNRWTLRLREEGGKTIACCKTPGKDAYTRGEWQTEAGDPEAALPELVRLGAPAQLLQLQALQPFCGAAFQRRAALLQLEGGTVCELALDEGELFAGSARAPLREMELELKRGPRAPMLHLAEVLQTQGLAEETRSKFARAMALATETGKNWED